MRRLFFFVNLLVIPLLSGWVVYHRLATPPAGVVTPWSFDYFKLALQWPPSRCSGHPKCPNNFTIHGLWPDNFSGPSLEFCNNRSRYIAITGPLLQRMQSNWPNIINHSDTGQTFWTHEWRKHGTCSRFNQVTYFNSALDRKGQYNFLRNFRIHRITPGPSSHYPASLIRSTVINLTSKIPDLLCVLHAGQRLTLHEETYIFASEEHLFHFRLHG
ncbi:hypothetical protein RHSIM_RhsimUnG0138300 [Rhododendron simsii]|uniref:Uncharacterized protein n=1 Tax=Rhododendron simsii TaxID=118357 RepID=A0A834G0Q0_RHOSS|nr:hypothetical protein RHSIM_RhsimUnG0138300 [Rhododendron simsii]